MFLFLSLSGLKLGAALGVTGFIIVESELTADLKGLSSLRPYS